jgi:hypothetical protein
VQAASSREPSSIGSAWRADVWLGDYSSSATSGAALSSVVTSVLIRNSGTVKSVIGLAYQSKDIVSRFILQSSIVD